MNPSGTLVLLDDELSDHARVERWMLGTGWQVHLTRQPSDLMAMLQTLSPDVLLLDYSLPGVSDWEVLAQVRDAYPPYELAVVGWSGVGTEAIATASMRLGAQDYLVKSDLNRMAFRQAMSRAVAARDAARALERANTDLAQFSSIAAHDLQGPLRRLAQSCGVLLEETEGQIGEDMRRLITLMKQDASALQELVSSLLRVARTGDSSPEPVDVRTCFLAVGAQVIGTAGEVRWDSAEESAVVLIDPIQLHQVFTNLLQNSLKYRSERPLVVQGRIMSSEPHQWQIEVEDNGMGFAPEDAERIFESFQRLRQNAEAGTGLGLVIVKRAVERHGGTIEARGETGRGATFVITLPKP